MADKLKDLDQLELKRQDTYAKAITQYLVDLRSIIKKNTDSFHKQLTKTNETLLLKMDDILCVDDINKHGKYALINSNRFFVGPLNIMQILIPTL
jgi:hypothetical protein